MNVATSRRRPFFGVEAAAGQQLVLESRVEALAAVLFNAEPTRPIDWVICSAVHVFANRSPVYSPPLSEWKITPATSPPRTAAAMHSAAFASDVS